MTKQERIDWLHDERKRWVLNHKPLSDDYMRYINVGCGRSLDSYVISNTVKIDGIRRRADHD